MDSTLKETLRVLDVNALRTAASEASSNFCYMGCPFNESYGGPKSRSGRHNCTKLRRNAEEHAEEQLCRDLCGKMFPLIINENLCPCWIYNATEVKTTFWKNHQEAIGGDV